MPDPRDFRFLADRVELGFYRRPNRLRQRSWLAGAALACLAAVWAALALGRGHNVTFSAGPVSPAHQMFENDCARCHTTWGPAERLVSLNAETSSISNAKCVTCHPGPPHQQRLVESHADVSCAACHREHRHNKALAEVADAVCLACHSDLTAPGHGGTEQFAHQITSFDGSVASGAHPEFAVQRLLKQTTVQDSGVDVVAWFLREDDRGTKLGTERWQDRSRIRFNHKLHLRPIDEHEQPLPGLRDGKGLWRDLSQSCQTCHQEDSEGRYMLPINYERHCAECHPLRFDDRAFPGMTVPHRDPAVVRGFLVEKFAGAALGDQANIRAAEPGKSDRFLDFPYAPHLPAEAAGQVKQQVDEIERGMPVPLTAAKAEHALFGPEARGGCRYCHEVVDPSPGELWKITETRIPERWMKHSRFRHRSHLLLDCRHCHAGVDASFSTGDVLLPDIALCRSCHAQEPKWKPQHADPQPELQGARTQCIECHVYHHAPGHGKPK